MHTWEKIRGYRRPTWEKILSKGMALQVIKKRDKYYVEVTKSGFTPSSYAHGFSSLASAKKEAENRGRSLLQIQKDITKKGLFQLKKRVNNYTYVLDKSSTSRRNLHLRGRARKRLGEIKGFRVIRERNRYVLYIRR